MSSFIWTDLGRSPGYAVTWKKQSAKQWASHATIGEVFPKEYRYMLINTSGISGRWYQKLIAVVASREGRWEVNWGTEERGKLTLYYILFCRFECLHYTKLNTVCAERGWGAVFPSLLTAICPRCLIQGWVALLQVTCKESTSSGRCLGRAEDLGSTGGISISSPNWKQGLWKSRDYPSTEWWMQSHLIVSEKILRPFGSWLMILEWERFATETAYFIRAIEIIYLETS